MKRSSFKNKQRKPLARKRKIRVAGKSTTAELKREIQALLRQIVIKRDKQCQRCGVPYGTEGVVFQCDHLLSRSNSATYADSRLCVLLCKPCHAWKSMGSNLRKRQYDIWMRGVLSEARVMLWDRCEEDSWQPRRTTAFDWKLAKLALEAELRKHDSALPT